jgi:hypothetical protein
MGWDYSTIDKYSGARPKNGGLQKDLHRIWRFYCFALGLFDEERVLFIRMVKSDGGPDLMTLRHDELYEI